MVLQMTHILFSLKPELIACCAKKLQVYHVHFTDNGWKNFTELVIVVECVCLINDKFRDAISPHNFTYSPEIVGYKHTETDQSYYEIIKAKSNGNLQQREIVAFNKQWKSVKSNSVLITQ